MNNIKKSAFLSLDSSSEWFGTSASLICLFYCGYLQHRLLEFKIVALVEQSNMLCLLELPGIVLALSLLCVGRAIVSAFRFADVVWLLDHGLLYYITNISIGSLQHYANSYGVVWLAHKFRRPVVFHYHQKTFGFKPIDRRKIVKIVSSKLLFIDGSFGTGRRFVGFEWLAQNENELN